VQNAYTTWLKHVVHWVRQIPLGSKPVFSAIKNDTKTCWSGFGGYLTSVLLAHAGLPPWMPTIAVIKSPARLARLCEAAFELFWMGHLSNRARLNKSLSYNGHTICATKLEVEE